MVVVHIRPIIQRKMNVERITVAKSEELHGNYPA